MLSLSLLMEWQLSSSLSQMLSSSDSTSSDSASDSTSVSEKGEVGGGEEMKCCCSVTDGSFELVELRMDQLSSSSKEWAALISIPLMLEVLFSAVLSLATFISISLVLVPEAIMCRGIKRFRL